MASTITVNPNTSGIPSISQGQRLPITSTGSGNRNIGDIGYKTNSTDLTGAGAILGGLLLGGGKGTTGGASGNKSTPNATKALADAIKNTSGSSGGLPSSLLSAPRGTASGTSIGGGNTGTVGGLSFPPGTTQADISRVAPGYVIAGVNTGNGDIIAQPDLMIGGGTLSGTGSVNFAESIPATGTYETVKGNIYDPDGNLYAIKNAGEGFTVKVAPDQWMNSANNQTYSNDELFQGNTSNSITSGIDLSSGANINLPDYSIGPNFSNPISNVSDLYTGSNDTNSMMGDMSSNNIGTSGLDLGGGYDASSWSSPSSFIDSFNPSSTSSFDTSSFDPSSWASDISSSFDPSSWASDIGSSFSDWGSNLANSFDFSNWFAKNGGLATPLMKDGGGVKGYAPGGTATADTNSPSGYFNEWNQPVDSGGNLVDSLGNIITSTNTTDGFNLGSTLNDIKGLISGSGISGAVMGGLLGNLLGNSTSSSPTGVDMSKVGVIAPRTTDYGTGPTKVVPYSDYNTTPTTGSDYSELYKNLGAPTVNKMADGGKPFYTYGKYSDPITNLYGGTPVGGLKGGGTPTATGVPLTQGRNDYRSGAPVNGIGDGQSDDIPAMLADGEYVIDAEIVSALGNGSNKAGSKVLDGMRQAVRSHKRQAPLNSIPPKAKSPLEYIKLGASMKGVK